MFIAFAKRSAVERVQEIKVAMVSGIWANTNYDEGQARKEMLEQIDQFTQKAIANIYGSDIEEEEIDKDSPFFAAMKVPEIDHNLERDRVGELA